MPLSLSLPYPVCYPLTKLARRICRSDAATRTKYFDQAAYFAYQHESTSDMMARFMNQVPIKGQVILDVGAGLGGRSPAWLEHGARRVYCIDINRQELAAGRRLLAQAFPTYADQVGFLHPNEVAGSGLGDVAILFDTFEHLVEPTAVLEQCFRWLRPGGMLWIGSIGWYHHAATHCFGYIPIPWSQVLFSERAIIRTIQRLTHDPNYVPCVWDQEQGLDRWDKVQSLRDRPGEPLNMLSLRSVRRVLTASPFRLVHFQTHGFSGRGNALAKPLSFLAKIPVAQELFHSYYTALLMKPAGKLNGSCTMPDVHQQERVAERLPAGAGNR